MDHGNLRRAARRVRVLLGLGAGLLAACAGSKDTTHEIPPGLVVQNDGDVVWNAPTKDRLGVRMPGAAATGGPSGAGGSGSMGGGEVAPAVDPSRPSPLGWTAPESWTDVGATSMRLANFQAGDPSVQCYVTVLGGDGGGILGNVNRWRGQLNLPPVDGSAVDAMARIPQLGTQAPLIEIDGETEAMFATISLHGTSSVFVKMLGPKELVLAERDRFVAFCASLKFQG